MEQYIQLENFERSTHGLTYKIETDSWTQRMTLLLPERKGDWGRDHQGIQDWHVHIAIFKTDSQQGATVKKMGEKFTSSLTFYTYPFRLVSFYVLKVDLFFIFGFPITSFFLLLKTENPLMPTVKNGHDSWFWFHVDNNELSNLGKFWLCVFSSQHCVIILYLAICFPIIL